jgi:hypothetical protein
MDRFDLSRYAGGRPEQPERVLKVKGAGLENWHFSGFYSTSQKLPAGRFYLDASAMS